MMPVWGGYQNTATRTAQSPGTLPATAAAAFAPAVLGGPQLPGLAIDGQGNIYSVGASPQGVVSAIGPTGNLAWSCPTGMPVGSGGAQIGADGTIYVAGASLIGVGASGTVACTLALGAAGDCSAPLVLSPDGTQLYVLATAAGASPASSLVGVALGGPPPNPAIAWTVPLGALSHSAPAVAADGTIYVGNDAGALLVISPAGSVLQTVALAVFPLGTPMIDAAGTVHVVAFDPTGNGTALYGYVPGTAKVLSWLPTAAAGIATAPLAAPALAPDGSILVGFGLLCRLTVDPVAGYTLSWVAAAGSGAVPGPAVVDAQGQSVVCGIEPSLTAFGATGAVLWSITPGSAAAAPALGADGTVYFADGATLTAVGAVPPPPPSVLQLLYQALDQGQSPAGTYPLTAATLTDPAVLAMVTAALGLSDGLAVTGTLTLAGDNSSLTLTGTGPFCATASTNLGLVFTADGEVISLALTASFSSTLALPLLFPELAGTFFTGVAIDGAGFTLAATAGAAVPPWTVAGTIDTAATPALATAAMVIPGLAGTLTVGGTISIGLSSYPTIALTVAASGTLSFAIAGGSWTLPPVALVMSAELNDATGAYATDITVSTELTFGGNALTLAASVLPAAGTIALTASTATPITLTDIASLVFWSNAQDVASAVQAALPPPVQTFTSFGLSSVQAVIAPATASVPILFVTFSTADWTAFAPSGSGTALTVSGAAVTIAVTDPFGSPAYAVSIEGSIALGTLLLATRITGPDWAIWASLSDGLGTATPQDLVAALGGPGTLPGSMPNNAVTSFDFQAQPAYGVYEARFSSGETWSLFTIGDLQVSFGGLSIGINLLETSPGGSTGVFLNAGGYLTIATMTLNIGGFFDSAGNASFYAVLTGPIQVPTLGDLVGAISSSLGNALPAGLAAVGSNIEITGFSVDLSNQANVPSSLSAAIATGADWGGWPILSVPFAFALTGVTVALQGDTLNGVTAAVNGTFAIGSGAVVVSVDLPYTGTVTFGLVAAAPAGAMPTVTDFLGLVSTAFVQALPAAVTAVTNNLTVTAFDVVIDTASSATLQSVSFAVEAAGAGVAQAWYVLGSSINLALSDFAVAGSYVSGAGASGTLSGVVLIGNNGGKVPLTAALSAEQDSWSVTLDPSYGQVALPTVGDVISVFSSTWAAMLPTAITSVGQGMLLTQFALDVAPSGNSATIEIEAPQIGWTGPTIAGFTTLSVTGFNMLASYAATGWTATLALDGTLFEQPATLTADLGTGMLIGTVDLDDLSIGTFCAGFGLGGSPQSWTDVIKITQISAAIQFVPSPGSASVIVTCDLADIDLSVGGTLTDISVTAKFYTDQDPTVCVHATWDPPVGPSIDGTMCYPFEMFEPDGTTGENGNVEDFPPAGPASLVGPSAAISLAIGDAIAAFGGVMAALAVAKGMLVGGYYDNSADEAACAAGALQAYGTNPATVDELLVIVAALKQIFPDDSAAVIYQAVMSGAAAANVTVAAGDLSTAVAVVYTTGTPTLDGRLILGFWPQATPAAMAAILLIPALGYGVPAVAASLPFLYPTGPDASVDAATVATAMAGQLPTAGAAAEALAGAGFPATNTLSALVSGYAAAVSTPAAAAAVLTAAGYGTGPAVEALVANGMGNASAAMVQAFAQAAPAGLFAALAAMSLPPLQVVPAMVTGFPAEYGTIGTGLAGAVAAGYPLGALGPALAAAFAGGAGWSAQAVATAVQPQGTAAQVFAVVAGGGFGPAEAAAAYAALAPTLWASADTAAGMAAALSPSYGAPAVLLGLQQNFAVAVATAVAACQILNGAGVSQAGAQAALIAGGFTTAEVTDAIDTVYGG